MLQRSLLHAVSRLDRAPATARRIAFLTGSILIAPSLLAPLQLSAATRPASTLPTTLGARVGQRGLSSSAAMASDEDYMAFLNKANEGVGGGQAQQSSGEKAVFKTLDEGSEVPKAIRDISPRPYYESDADEPFEHVSLKWQEEGGLPDEVEFAKLIRHWDPDQAEIEIMDPAEWDPRGQYKQVLKAVRDASKGNDVRVYCVARDKTRREYWVVSRSEGRIVGMRALAIES